VESARLLLNSKSWKFPNGLANGSGLVGKNLMFSTLAKGYGTFEVGKLPAFARFLLFPSYRPHRLSMVTAYWCFPGMVTWPPIP